MRLATLMICAVIVCANAQAQVEPTFRSLGIAEGLPASMVPDIIQSRDGYMWIASQDGLARFDGVGFQVFRRDPGDEYSIPCNDTQTVFEDSRHQLWVGCADSGFARLTDPAAGKFQNYSREQKRLGFDSLDIFAFAQSAAGHLWLGTYRRGVLRLDEQGKLHRLSDWMTIDPAMATLDVLEMKFDSAGDLWLATTSGLWRIRSVDQPGLARVEQVINEGMVLSLLETRDGFVWVGSVTTLRRIRAGAEAASLELVHDFERGIFIEGIGEDASGLIWLGTGSGLIKINNDGAQQIIRPRPSMQGGLPATAILDIQVDQEGGLWLATRMNGLLYARPDRDNFELIRHDFQDDQSLPSGRLIGVTQCPDGRTLIGTAYGGLAEIARDGRVFRRGKTPNQVSEGRATHGMVCAPDGGLWLGGTNSITRMDLVQGKERSWTTADGLAPGLMETPAAGKNGDVWFVANGRGVSRIDAKGKVRSWQTAEQGIAVADFEQIEVAADGAVWLADALGLRTLDASSEVFHAVPGGPKARVSTFLLLPDQKIWTAGIDGLEHWAIENNRLRRLQTIGAAEGLPAAEYFSMQLDQDGLLWVAGARGLWRIALDPLKVELVDSRLGLPRLQYATRPMMRLIDERIVVPATEGVLRFKAAKLTTVTVPPLLQMASASVRRGDIRVALDVDAKNWDLRWNDRDLTVETRVLSYADPAANLYGFKLQGHDDAWVENGSHSERAFTQVAPGTHVLAMRARNVAGVPASNELQRTIHMERPPWLRWQAFAFYLLCVAALIGFTFSAWKARIERRHQIAWAEERRVLAELANTAKSEFLADVGHEIRTPMAGVLGMADLLASSPLDANQNRWAVSIKRGGEHMMRLINDLLDLSRIEAGKLEINERPTELASIVEDICALEVPLMQARGLEFKFELDEALPAWIMCDGRRLRQILLNLVNNAMKFTEHGFVHARMQRIEPDTLFIEVRDSGVGMTQTQIDSLFVRFRQTEYGQTKGGSGLGLAITSQLVRLLGGVIAVRSEAGNGSVFSVRLPLLAAPSQRGRNSAAEMVGARPLAGIALLLVEDDVALREIMLHQLTSLGAEVTAAAQGLDALSRFQPDRHRIAVLDLDLPGIDGFALVGLLRQRTASLFAAAITARSDAGTEQACQQAGFDAFLRKPVSAEQLAAAARDWRQRLLLTSSSGK